MVTRLLQYTVFKAGGVGGRTRPLGHVPFFLVLFGTLMLFWGIMGLFWVYFKVFCCYFGINLDLLGLFLG